jgi:hypothetical protein
MKQKASAGLIALRTLAAIRLVNGGLGLIAPQILIRRLGTDPAAETSAFYPFRMFGVRTIVLGADLLTLRGAPLKRASILAIVIHAIDTVSAAWGGIQGEVSPRTSRITTAISGTNTLLALIGYFARPRE